MRIATTIFDNVEKKSVPASLIVGVDPRIIDEVGERWKRERIQKAAHQGKFPQHFHWEWGNKASLVNGLLAYEFFAIECQGIIEGLMLTESDAHRAELPPDQGKPLLYIEFIESAPGNVKQMSDNPRYRGVGTRLMEGAILHSLELEFEGRVGLLALSQAEDYYISKGLEKVRMDAKTGLNYYEWTTKTSQAVLNQRRKNDLQNE